MKKLFNLFLVLMITTVIMSINVYANGENLPTVNLRVEGPNSTIMSGNVEADTFIKAVQKLGEQNGIEVVMKNISNSQQLYSIDRVENNMYNSKDSWRAYIIRAGEILDVDNIVDANLNSQDNLVLYYGNPDTKKITDINANYLDGKLEIAISSSLVKWNENNGVWEHETISVKLENVSVHLETGDGKVITKKVDDSGKAMFDVTIPNIYTYYADGYRKSDVPTVIKTAPVKIAVGLDSQSFLTRAEIVALFVNYFDIVYVEQDNPKVFEDISDDSVYKNQVYIAASNGLINGDGNNLFRPNDRVTFQEMAVIMYKIYENKPDMYETVDNIESSSEWAKPYIEKAIQKGAIKYTDGLKWEDYVTLDKLISII